MARTSGWLAGAGLAALAGIGCAAVPPLDNPVLVRPGTGSEEVENPVVVAPGTPTPEGYAFVYERVLDAVDDYFEVVPGPRYSGQIETLPKIAAGYEQPWKAGSPDPRERLLASLQSIRHRAVVRIFPGERGGFRVSVEVYKELEDVFVPQGARLGPASFREAPVLDRQVEVNLAAAAGSFRWIPVGRDPAYEQVLLRKIQVAVCR